MYTIKKPDSIKRRKRIGCGTASGHGKTSGRGSKGQLSRAGSKKRPWFEGGQMPLQRRVPKRGFTNIFKKRFQIINISLIDKLNLENIDPVVLLQHGVIQASDKKVKVLGNGEIKRSVKIVADYFSKAAIEKIKNAGGEVILREPSVKSKKRKIFKKKEI